MLSVVIAAHDSGHRLVATLAALVPGAIAGLVREVIVTDGGSTDIAEIADAAGCRLLVSGAPVGARLKAAAEAARATWLLFLRPGCVPDAGWIPEVRTFVETSELSGRAEKTAAVFRLVPPPGATRRRLSLHRGRRRGDVRGRRADRRPPRYPGSRPAVGIVAARASVPRLPRLTPAVWDGSTDHVAQSHAR